MWGSPEAEGRCRISANLAMNLEPPKASQVGHQGDGGTLSLPGKGPPKFKRGKPGSSRASPPRKVSKGKAELWEVALREKWRGPPAVQEGGGCTAGGGLGGASHHPFWWKAIPSS